MLLLPLLLLPFSSFAFLTSAWARPVRVYNCGQDVGSTMCNMGVDCVCPAWPGARSTRTRFDFLCVEGHSRPASCARYTSPLPVRVAKPSYWNGKKNVPGVSTPSTAHVWSTCTPHTQRNCNCCPCAGTLQDLRDFSTLQGPRDFSGFRWSELYILCSSAFDLSTGNTVFSTQKNSLQIHGPLW